MPLPNASAVPGVAAVNTAARVDAANARREVFWVGTEDKRPSITSFDAARVTTGRPAFETTRAFEVVGVATTRGDTVDRANIAEKAVSRVGVCEIGGVRRGIQVEKSRPKQPISSRKMHSQYLLHKNIPLPFLPVPPLPPVDPSLRLDDDPPLPP